MKKKVLTLVLVVSMLMTTLLACASKNESKDTNEGTPQTTENSSEKKDDEVLPTSTKVILNEVAHSIFYAPMYVAIENGYFDEEGIDLELVTGFGAI